MKFVVLAGLLAFSTLNAQQPSPTTFASIQKIQDDWATAIRTRNAAMLDRILGAEYYIIDVTDGVISDRAANFEGIINKPTITWKSVTNRLRSIQEHGNVVVALGEFIGEGTENGKMNTYHDSWMTVFVKRDGRWVAVASHEAPIPPKK